MEYKGFIIKTLHDFYANEANVAVFKGDKMVYESASWHEVMETYFEQEEKYMKETLQKIDRGEIS